MITEITTDHEAFKLMLEKIYKKNLSTDPSQKIKDKAWDKLLGLGLPTRKSEAFQYIRLRALYSQSFEPAQSTSIDPDKLSPYILPECAQSVLVLVNGHYRPDLSRLSGLPKRLVIQPLLEANRTYGSFLNNQWTKILKEEIDPFALLNAALFHEGIFIYVPPKTVIDVPLQILHVDAARDSHMLIAPRIHGFIGSQSQMNVISTHAHLSGQAFTTLTFDLAMDDDSHMRYSQIPLDISKDSWHFDAFRASLKRNCTLKTILTAEGSTTLRNDYRVTLTGENSEASLSGIHMLSNQNEAHAHILMEHQAPQCRSMQLFKSVLNDVSRSSFEGKILVRQAAQKTEAFQLNNNLLLSDKAKADSKPNLEIFADDVKASHGATVGQLDNEQLFYLKTRGFSDHAAKNLLVFGFCKEVFDLIPYSSISQNLIRRAQRYMAQES